MSYMGLLEGYDCNSKARFLPVDTSLLQKSSDASPRSLEIIIAVLLKVPKSVSMPFSQIYPGANHWKNVLDLQPAIPPKVMGRDENEVSCG